ncbi:ankyrin repeat and socs box protein 3 [Plakobranchus ocellatus]|uniref:Ankyrin repeat and socs box protein 3 n=1 Tax=Plakobranchus ocellatus TaxID=259542 RepID=A0AAV4DW86_9GAST|nr:ankyrin repeat and socs box protein 3 [Plakobranchus ocellatus]
MQRPLQQKALQYATVGVAARLGDLVAVQEMVWHGRPIDVFDNRGWSPIHEAAYSGNTGCLEFLLRQPGVDPDWVTHAKETALILAARQGQHEAVVALINFRADPNLSTNEGYTPLWEALNNDKFHCFRTLVKKGADVNLRIYTGYSVLHLAAEKGCAHSVNLLLQHGADVDVYADHNLSPLFLACHNGHIDCVKVLVKFAKERGLMHIVNAAAEDNATPLLIAAQEGHAEIIEFLLKYGADANISVSEETSEQSVALQFAVYKGHKRCVHLLLPYTDMSVFNIYDKMHPLVQALKHPDTTILEMLSEYLDIHRLSPVSTYLKSKLGHLTSALVPARTCSLLCLVKSGWPMAGAEFLLRHGVSPNISDEDEEDEDSEEAMRPRGTFSGANEEELPPLIVALWTNNVPLFQLLLRHGANPNFYHKNVTGNVAMLLAFQNDLERDLSAMIVRNSRQPNFQIFYIWQLFLAGAESHSLFDLDGIRGGQTAGVGGVSPSTGPPSNPAITNLFGLKFHMFKRKENLVPVLALLMCISDHASLPNYVLNDSDFDTDQRKLLQTISEKTNSLSHRCRRVVVHQLGKENCYCRSSMEKLRIPVVLQDYLMFSELEPPLQEMILKFITVNPPDETGDGGGGGVQ